MFEKINETCRLFQREVSSVSRQTSYTALGGRSNKLQLIKCTLILRRQEN